MLYIFFGKNDAKINLDNPLNAPQNDGAGFTGPVEVSDTTQHPAGFMLLLAAKTTGVILMKKLVELYGWYGMTAIVLAYALASFSAISASGLIYQVLNGTGALGIVFVSFAPR